MLKRRKNQIILVAGAGMVALLLGAAASVVRSTNLGDQWPIIGQLLRPSEVPEELNLSPNETSQVLPLASRSPQERAADLEAIASGTRPASAADQARARYLLAADLIQQGQGGSAIPLLQDLEQADPVLAPYVFYQRAKAYTASGDTANAEATWQALLQAAPDAPIAAEALFALGQTNPQYWDQALSEFPAHPRSVEIAQTRLQQNPNQPQLLLLLARHGLYLRDIVASLDRLVYEYSDQLTPEDWEAIAFGYWEKQIYLSAGDAYAQAPSTPLNAYRAGRGRQLGRRPEAALAAYAQLAETFPDAEETATGLLRMAALTDSRTNAIAYLDRVIQQFPDRAAEALIERAILLDEMQSPESAAQARQSVLSQYSSSDAAATLRWRQAEQQASSGNLSQAWEWARQIVTDNPNSEQAPEAAFWVSKWALQLGESEKAETALEYVLTHYPGTYYAWRAATLLGWDVGDFTTVRAKIPDVVQPPQRPALPAGSETLQALYQLGQDQEAWALWQVEFSNPMQPSVAEQFTDGLMRLGIGDNLEGIFMVSSLAYRETQTDQAEYQALKEQRAYWQALYPFPFMGTIQSWSQQRQLNPMLVTALIRQESRFEPGIESVAGATGLMQVMPDTADWIAAQINLSQYDMVKPDDNVKLGTWYLDYTHREYDNNSLFAVASYNAGPGSVADWIDRFGFSDPDLFVEQIPFPETKGYVESVFENYWNYLRLYNPEVSNQLARYSDEHAKLAEILP